MSDAAPHGRGPDWREVGREARVRAPGALTRTGRPTPPGPDGETAPHAPWLVLIDPQRIFSAPESPWGSPQFDAAAGPMLRLARAFGERVVVTRFVADPEPRGSWEPYYREWPFAQVPGDDPLYALDGRFTGVGGAAAARGHVVTEPTFGKWTQRLRAIVGERPRLILAGVSTDCCVLATAVPAADAGATVTVVSDACAGSSDANQAAALHVLGLFGPQVTLVDTSDLLSPDPAAPAPAGLATSWRPGSGGGADPTDGS